MLYFLYTYSIMINTWLDKGEKIVNVPNAITLSRGALMIWSSISVAMGWPRLEAALAYLAGTLGDGLDGLAARKLKQATAFGKRFDPIVDATAFLAGLSALAVSSPEIHEKILFTSAAALQILYSGQLYLKWKTLPDWAKDQLWPTKVAKAKTAVMMLSMTTLLWWPHLLESLRDFFHLHHIVFLQGSLHKLDASIHAGAIGGIGMGILGTLFCWYHYNKLSTTILQKT